MTNILKVHMLSIYSDVMLPINAFAETYYSTYYFYWNKWHCDIFAKNLGGHAQITNHASHLREQ